MVIGYEESSQLEVEPAKYFVLVTKREKRACRSCEDLGVVSALLPPRIIEKCPFRIMLCYKCRKNEEQLLSHPPY